jgi:hypothetical protein
MQTVNLDQKINNFLNRKQVEFPELAEAGRQGSRTVKYAQTLRASGQLLFSR